MNLSLLLSWLLILTGGYGLVAIVIEISRVRIPEKDSDND